VRGSRRELEVRGSRRELEVREELHKTREARVAVSRGKL